MATELNKEFIVNLQGKSFVTYNGLVDLAHQIGIKSIETNIIQFPNEENKLECIVKAIVTTEDDKVFEDYGDASPGSVSSMLRPHIIRMASTRAKARALRDLTNVGMTAIEELGGDDEVANTNTPSSNQSSSKASEKQLGFMYKLVTDKNFGTDKMAAYIKDNFNKDSSKELTKSEASKIIKMLNEEE